MHIYELVKQTWREAGLYSSRKVKVRSFLKYFDAHPNKGWDDYIEVFRKDYYDVFNDLIPPLLKSDDKLLRLTLIRKANLKNRKELNVLKKLLRECNPIQDKLELIEIAELQHRGLMAEFGKRKDLPSEVRRLVEHPPGR
jgi:hypothetical protein